MNQVAHPLPTYSNIWVNCCTICTGNCTEEASTGVQKVSIFGLKCTPAEWQDVFRNIWPFSTLKYIFTMSPTYLLSLPANQLCFCLKEHDGIYTRIGIKFTQTNWCSRKGMATNTLVTEVWYGFKVDTFTSRHNQSRCFMRDASERWEEINLELRGKPVSLVLRFSLCLSLPLTSPVALVATAVWQLVSNTCICPSLFLEVCGQAAAQRPHPHMRGFHSDSEKVSVSSCKQYLGTVSFNVQNTF